MVTHSLKCLLTATLLAAASALSSTALAENLTLYAKIVKHVDAYNEAKDFGVGHRRIRQTEIRLSENGEVVGKNYGISTVVAVDRKNGTETRVAMGVTQLPNGSIWTEIKGPMPLKSPLKLGHKHTGIILGGTGDYAGVTGTYDLEVRKDGKYAVSVLHIVREKNRD